MKRVRNFLVKILLLFAFFAVVFFVLYLVQAFYHPFDSQIAWIKESIDYLNTTTSYYLIAGISAGTIIFIGVIVLFPMLLKGIDRKNYWWSIVKGLVASFVFYLTQLLYRYAENLGRIYFLLALLAIIIATLILIEIITLSMREERHVELRTDLIAAVTSGLIFGLLLRIFILFSHKIENLLSIMPKE